MADDPKRYDDNGNEITLTISNKPKEKYDDNGYPLTNEDEIRKYQEGLTAQGVPQEGSLFARSWDALNKPLVSLSPQMESARQEFAKTHPIIGGVGNFLTDTMLGMSSPATLGLTAISGGAGLAEKAGLSRVASALETPAKAASAAMVGHGAYKMYEEPDTAGKLGGAIEAGLGALGMRKPSTLSEARASIQAPEDAAITPPAGQVRDINTATALSGSMDQILNTREATKPIVDTIQGAWDNGYLPDIGKNIRVLDKITAGMNNEQLEAFGRTIENKATDVDGALLSSIPDIDTRLVTYRELMDNIFLKANIARSGKLGYIDDYFTHMAKQDDPSAMADIFNYQQGKNAIQSFFERPYIGGEGGEAVGVYDKGVGGIAESPFAKERKNLMEDLVDYNVNRVGRAYIESMARETHLRPAIEQATEHIKTLPDSKLKELAEKYVKNVTNFNSAPELAKSARGMTRFLIDTSSRSLLGFSPYLQGLHAMRLGPVYADMGPKYFTKGVAKMLSNPINAYKETASMGLLPNELMPFRFQTRAEKIASILNFKSYVDFLDRSVAYNGYKAKYLDQGLEAADASRMALRDAKRISFTVDPTRANMLINPDSTAMIQRLASTWKAVPLKVAEWMVRTAAQAKQNPAAARRMIILLGATTVSHEMGGPSVFHMPMSAVHWTLGPIAEMGKIASYAMKGDLDKAAEEFTLWITPAGKSVIEPLLK